MIMYQKSDNPSVVNNNNEKIINCLLDEISFLRKEVASKDEIIKLIINETAVIRK